MTVFTKTFVPYKQFDRDIILKVTEYLRKFNIALLNSWIKLFSYDCSSSSSSSQYSLLNTLRAFGRYVAKASKMLI